MFPRWKNRTAPRRIQTIPASYTKLGPFRYHLGRSFGDPSDHAPTKRRTTNAPISGAVQPAERLHPTDPKRRRSLVKVLLPNKSSVSASAYDDDSGEGDFLWEKEESLVLHKQVSTSVIHQKGRNRNELLNIEAFRKRGLIAIQDFKFSLKTCLSEVTLPILIKPFFMCMRRRKPSAIEHNRRTNLEINSDSSSDAAIFSFEDSRYGRVKLSFTSRDKLAVSFKLIQGSHSDQSASKSSTDEEDDPSSDSSGIRSPSIRSDIRYEFKKNSYVLRTRVESSYRAAQLFLATNPLQITPQVQIPLCNNSKSCPLLSWERKPKWGIGKFKFKWKGIQFSTDWKNSTFSIRKKMSTGGKSAISLDSKRKFELNHTLVSKSIREGTVLSLESCMTNQKGMTGVTMTTTAPWGSVSAHVRTSMACGLSLRGAVKGKKRSLHFKTGIENLKTASFRLGVHY